MNAAAITKELKQHHTPITPQELGCSDYTYAKLADATPDFILENDPNNAYAFMIIQNKLHLDQIPGREHVEIAKELGLLDENTDPPWWKDPAIVQGRIGTMLGYPVISLYPYYFQTVTQLQHALRQLPTKPNIILVGMGTRVYRVSDLTNTSTKPSSTLPGHKWWAPNSESYHKLSAI